MPNSVKKHSFSGCPECKYTEVECSYCHKRFKRLKSELTSNKSGYVYCSKECGNRHKNEIVTMWNNGSNYRRNAFNIYPHECAICGWDEDERVLEVHHLDEDRKHNNIENLRILCPICHKKLTLHLYSYQELFDKYNN
jgi:5-methylcytosine-specific restriction endonuclease McrA